MLALWSTLHDRLVRPRPPAWARVRTWVILCVVMMAGSMLFLPSDGRGRGILFSYAIFPDGRHVLEPLSIPPTPIPAGASADLTFSANIWSVQVLGFRRWRCDVSAGDRMHGPMPPTGMALAGVDALRREGCAAVIAASRGEPSQWGAYDINGSVPLREDIPGIELMAEGGGRGCGGGIRGFIGEVMHSMQRWISYVGIACIVPAIVLSGLREGLRRRLQRRIDRAGKSLCPLCGYPVSGPQARCPECGVDGAAEVERCRVALAGGLAGLIPTSSRESA